MRDRRRVAVSSQRVRAPVALLLAVAATACTTGLDIPSAVGVWALQTANGEGLPAVLTDDGNIVVSISRALFLIQSETCILDATYISTIGGSPQQPEDIGLACTWQQDGADLSFIFGDSDSGIGFIEGTQITFTNQAGFVFVYARVS